MSIAKIKPGTGFVFVEIPPVISTIKTQSGVELYIDTTFEPERYANVWATVVSVPEKLKTKTLLEKRDKAHFISKDNDIRVVPGDKVYFHYLTIKNAKKNYDKGTYFEDDGKRYALLPYSSLFFAVRKIAGVTSCPTAKESELIDIRNSSGISSAIEYIKKNTVDEPINDYAMLNDWVLIEPIRKGQHVEKIPFYGNVIVDDELSTGKIAVITNTPYRSTEGIVKAAPPDCGLLPGERVVFERESDVPVEYDLTRTLDKPYFRMKLEDIIAKRDDTTFQLVRDYCLIIKDEAAEETTTGFFIPEIAQEQPFRGKAVMVGPDVKEVLANESVVFERGQYTEFPWGNSTGQLVREEKVQLRLCNTN